MVEKQAQATVKKTFLDMSEQERVEALVSGICNSGPKALALYVMKKGKEYTNGELIGAAETFLGQSLPFRGKGILHAYCRQSLGPISFVVEKKVVREHMLGGRELLAFAITDDGEIFGKPIIESFLFVAQKLNVSLNDLNGSTTSHGSLRRGYTVTKILEFLSDGQERANKDIVKLGLSNSNLGDSLPKLAELGIVEYESAKIDSYASGASEKNLAKIKLIDVHKLDYYLENGEKLKEDVLKIKPYFKRWKNLRDVLKLKKEVLDIDSLSLNLSEKAKRVFSSQIIVLLTKLDIYEYSRFGFRNMSKVQITERGLLAYELAYKPIMQIARNPHAVMDYLRPKLDASEIVMLFREEMARYANTSNSLKHNPIKEKSEFVLSLLREKYNNSQFRKKDLQILLREKDETVVLEKPKIDSVMADLRDKGLIEREKRGYYKLKIK